MLYGFRTRLDKFRYLVCVSNLGLVPQQASIFFSFEYFFGMNVYLSWSKQLFFTINCSQQETGD